MELYKILGAAFGPLLLLLIYNLINFGVFVG